jgi:hypothetical protein
MTTILFEGNNYFFGRQGNSAVTSIVLEVYVSLFLVFILTMSMDYNGVQKITKYKHSYGSLHESRAQSQTF